MAYSKLYSSIVHSSIWCEDANVRLLFVTLLALCDRDGYVYGSRLGIERAANLIPGISRDPWEVLLSPDPNSADRLRAPEQEGRRIEEVPGGFRLLNFAYYRGLRNDEDRKAQNRKAKRKSRQSANVSHGQPASACVSLRQPRSADVLQRQPISEAESEADTESKAESDSNSDSKAKSKSKSKSKTLPRKAAQDAAREQVESFVLTDELRAWAYRIAPAVDVDRATDSWRAYYTGNGFKTGKNMISSGLATWQGWILREGERYHDRATKRAGRPEPELVTIEVQGTDEIYAELESKK